MIEKMVSIERLAGQICAVLHEEGKEDFSVALTNEEQIIWINALKNLISQQISLKGFILRVLGVYAKYDCSDFGLWWRVDGEYAPITFFAPCNDVFYWATADAEPITPENIEILEQSFEDCKVAEEVTGIVDAPMLFCCRVRKMRPQGPMYKHIDKKLWPLFDAAGPERTDSDGAASRG